LPTEDVYRCPAGEKLAYRYTNENGIDRLDLVENRFVGMKNCSVY
jgi:argininosuccinate synthase